MNSMDEMISGVSDTVTSRDGSPSPGKSPMPGALLSDSGQRRVPFRIHEYDSDDTEDEQNHNNHPTKKAYPADIQRGLWQENQAP